MRGRIRLGGEGEWLPVEVQAGEQLVITAGGTEIGAWAAGAFTISRTLDGFTLDVDGEQLELQVEHPEALETAYPIGRGDLRTRFHQAQQGAVPPPAGTSVPRMPMPAAPSSPTTDVSPGDNPKSRKGQWAAGIVAVFVIAGVCGGDRSGEGPDTVAAATTTTRQETSTTRAVTSTVRRTTTTALPAPSSGLSADEMESLFIYYMRAWSEDKPVNFIDGLSDSAILGLAEATCDLWADGLSFEPLALAMMAAVEGQGWDALDETNVEAMGTLVGGGTEALCPQYSDRLP